MFGYYLGRVAIVVAPWSDPLFMERSRTQHFGPQERSNFFGSVRNVAPPEPVTWPRWMTVCQIKCVYLCCFASTDKLERKTTGYLKPVPKTSMLHITTVGLLKSYRPKHYSS